MSNISKIKAVINGNGTHNAKNHDRDKELVNRMQVVATYKGKLYRPVDIRLWMGRSNSASVVYCSLWVHSRHKKIECSGTGSAGGGGYHKESAAMQEALWSAGIDLRQDGKKRFIDGAGENPMKDAAIAIAKAVGFTGQMIIV